MTKEDQELIKSKGYALAMRYFDNAKDALKNADKEGRFFKDPKYVSSASGIAYRGALVALEHWLKLKGQKKGISIDLYRMHITKLDKNLLRDLNLIYNNLHLAGYYDCTNSVATIEEGFKVAKEIIERVKPQGVA